MRNTILSPVTFTLVLQGPVAAQQTGGRFLLWRPTATANSMGGVGTALARDAFASYFNPAGLAFSTETNLAGSFVRPVPFLPSTAHTYVAVSHNDADIGAFAGSANLYRKGKQVRTFSSGPMLVGAEDGFDWQFKLSYARFLSENFSVGGSISLLRIQVSDGGTEFESGKGRSTSALFDLGMMMSDLLQEATWEPSGLDEPTSFDNVVDPFSHRGISVGLSLLNLGPKLTFIDPSQADNPPSVLFLGFAYSPLRSNFVGLLVAAELEKQLFEDSQIDYAHWGAELRMGRFLSLRGGYYQDTYGPKNSYWTWGGGIHLRYASVNVARYTRALLPVWHVDGTFSWEL